MCIKVAEGVVAAFEQPDVGAGITRLHLAPVQHVDQVLHIDRKPGDARRAQWYVENPQLTPLPIKK